MFALRLVLTFVLVTAEKSAGVSTIKIYQVGAGQDKSTQQRHHPNMKRQSLLHNETIDRVAFDWYRKQARCRCNICKCYCLVSEHRICGRSLLDHVSHVPMSGRQRHDRRHRGDDMKHSRALVRSRVSSSVKSIVLHIVGTSLAATTITIYLYSRLYIGQDSLPVPRRSHAHTRSHKTRSVDLSR